MIRMFSTLVLICLVGLVIHQDGLLASAISTEKFLTLTPKEKVALENFRVKVQPILTNKYMHQDSYLIRWLRARDLNLDSAEEMLRENLRWRKENNIDSIRSENWGDMISDFPLTTDTYDRIGQPIGVVDISLWDFRRVILKGQRPRFMRFVTYLVENLTGQVIERQEKGMNVTQFVILFNADGFNVVQHACPICLPGWIQFMQLFDKYYPQWLDEFIIVEATQTVQIVLNAVRPIVSQNTRVAIKCFGPNKRIWMNYLDKKISKDQLGKQYGGTKSSVKF